jgi:hypothetical protein
MSASVSNSSLTGVTLNVTSGTPPDNVGTQTIPVSSLSVGANSVQITDSSILTALQSGDTIDYSLSCSYANGKSVVSTAGTPYTRPLTFVSTSLLARYDASDASSYTLSVGNVTQWNDLTGNGYHLTANGTGPTTTTINSITAFDFNSNRGLIRTSVPLTRLITMFMVATYKAASNQWGNFMHHGDHDMDWSLRKSFYSDYVNFHSNNDNEDVQLLMTNNVNYIWVCRIVGNTRQLWAYSDTQLPRYISGIPVSITPNYNKTLYVGKSDSNEACNSTIGEILYYYASLSDDDVTNNVTYLKKKWFNM